MTNFWCQYNAAKLGHVQRLTSRTLKILLSGLALEKYSKIQLCAVTFTAAVAENAFSLQTLFNFALQHYRLTLWVMGVNYRPYLKVDIKGDKSVEPDRPTLYRSIAIRSAIAFLNFFDKARNCYTELKEQ